MSAPTLVSYTASAYDNLTTTRTVTVASVQVGDVLVAVGASEDAPQTLSKPSGFTLAKSSTPAGFAPAYIWTMTAVAAGSVDVTVTCISGNVYWGFSVYLLRGVTSIGTGVAVTGSGAPSLSVTTTTNNAAMIVLSTDWNAVSGSSRTWRPTATEKLYAYSSGISTFYSAIYADAGTAGAKTVGLSAPAGQQYAIVALPINGPTVSKPVANAGVDQNVVTGSTVTLNGSGTNSPTSYQWTQTAGPTVTLSSSTAAAPTFTAPASATTLTFSFTASNAGGTSAPDTVNITVTEPVYNFPSSLLTPGTAADDGGTSITLGQMVTALVNDLVVTALRWYAPSAMAGITPYVWDTINGAAFIQSGPTVSCVAGWNTLPLTAPVPIASGQTLMFGVDQSSGQKYTALASAWPQSTTQFSVADQGSRFSYNTEPAYLNPDFPPSDAWYGVDIVATVGQPPVVNAGPDQTAVEPTSVVTLSGSGTNSPTSYLWSQTGGTAVTLSSTTVASPTFTAPADVNGQTLTFQLVATNSSGSSAPDSVTVTVLPQLEWALVGGSWVPTSVTLL